jgi:xylulokinase
MYGFGSAILGAFGSGEFSSIEDAVNAMVKVEGEFTPNKNLRALYQDQHKIYRGFYEAMANAGQYKALHDFSLKYN